MSVIVKTVRVAAETAVAPNTQDITTADLGGFTPKAAIFIVNRAISDGTAADEHVNSYGCATGASNEWVHSQTDGHNLGTTDGYTRWRDDACIAILDPTDGTIDGEAEFSAFITNGVRINWVDEPASAYFVTVILFAGSDVSAHANNIGIGNAADLETNCEQPGFEPDIIFTAHQRYVAEFDMAHGLHQMGLVHWDGVSTVTERCIYMRARDARATSETILKTRNDYGIEHVNDWYGEFTNFDSSGFSMITRNAGGNNSWLQYLAISFGGAVESKIGTYTTPTATGDDSETGVGFTPQFAFMFTSLAEVEGTQYTDNRAGSIGVSTFDGINEFSSVVSTEDAVGTSNTQSLSDDRAIVVPDDDGTLDIEATFVSFDTNGWTVNYSNAPATAKVFPYLAIEEIQASTKVAVTRVNWTVDTGPYTQDITTADLGGLTPKAAIIEVVGADVDGTVDVNARYSKAFTDGTTHKLFAARTEDGGASSAVREQIESDYIGWVTQIGGTGQDGACTFSNWIPNGIRIAMANGDEPTDDFFITVTFFAGSDLSVDVGSISLGNAVQTVDVSTVGFEPDLVFHLGADGAAFDFGSNILEVCHGVSSGGVSPVDRCVLISSAGGQSTSVNYQWTRTTALCAILGNGNEDWYATTQDYDSGGFTYNVQSRGANNADAAWLALNFNSLVDAWVGTYTTPTSTGDDAITDPGFTPQAVGMFPSVNTAIDTEGDSNIYTFGGLVFDEDDEYCNTISDEDGVGTMNSQSLSDNTAVEVPDDAGSSLLTGSFSSFDANGWTINYSAVGGSAYVWPAWAIGAIAVAAAGIDVPDWRIRKIRKNVLLRR